MSSHDYTVIKVKLKQILKNGTNYSKLFEAITRSNELITLGYMFMRSFILYVIENNEIPEKEKITEPKLNINFIRLAFSVISNDNTPKKGRPFDAEKKDGLDVLREYFVVFTNKTGAKFINATNLSYILGQTYKQIHISIINNIKYHFDKHLWKYIKNNFVTEYEQIRKLNNSDKLKEYYSELDDVKNDLYNNTRISKKSYHKWIESVRGKIIPNTYTEKKFEKDVEKNTFDYLKCMYHINNYIQDKQIKSYQIFPLKTSCYQNHIKINTSALIDIFYNNDKINEINELSELYKEDYFRKAGNTKFQEALWNDVFCLKNISKKKPNKLEYNYKRKGFSFNYEIDTDGFAVSLNFINNSKIPNKEKRKTNFSEARRKTNNEKRQMTAEEFKEFQEQKTEVKEKKEEDQKELEKQKRADKSKAFKELPKEEQDKIKNQLNENSEFPYIERLFKNMTEEEKKSFIQDFADGKILPIDPGKRSPLYMMASNKVVRQKKIEGKKFKANNFGISVWNDHKIMNYTSKTRSKCLKRKHYRQLIEGWKNDTTGVKFKGQVNEKNEWSGKSLKQLEEELSKYNSKSCKHSDFLNYVKSKLEYNKKVSIQYDTDYLHKLNWFNYLNKNGHENDLLNHIENEFGKDVIIIIGDWSGKGRFRFESTPHIALKRKLAERFKVYLIDEYLTSKIHYKHHIECKNLKVKIEKKELVDPSLGNDKLKVVDKEVITSETIIQAKKDIKKVHAVLTYKIVNEDMGCKISEMGCINRDKNSILNMEAIIQSLITIGKRPEIFSRKTNRSDRKVKPADARGANSVGVKK